jgi:phosphoribosyl 1,2-cyclic phosphate phosphodiesterase
MFGDGMRITLLGTGDTIGTPKVGCSCSTCIHALETGRERLRTSVLVEAGGNHILIDTSPDLRTQLLKAKSPHIDAVLWTHGHYDHFVGYNEFYRVQKFPPAFAAPPVMEYIRQQLHFLKFTGTSFPVYDPFDLCGMTITFVPVCHPPIYACGVILEYGGVKFVHTGDTNRNIPPKSVALMKDPDLLFVDAIAPGHMEGSKHMSYGEALTFAQELHAREFRCVHMSHLIPWDFAHIGTDGEQFRF